MPKIALAQIKSVVGAKKENLKKIEKYIAQAAERDVDLIIFPELAITGYVMKDLVYILAEEIPGSSTERIGLLAQEYGMYIVAGMPEKDSKTKLLYNSAVLIGPEGVVGIHRKKHLPTYGLFEEGRYFRPWMGDVQVFSTKLGNIGILICFDVFFPELSRILTLKDAHLIIVISAAPDISQKFFKTFIHARALENTVYVAYVNTVGFYEGIGFFGGSHLRGPLGQLLANAKLYEEDLVITEINFSELDYARSIRPILKDFCYDDVKYLHEAANFSFKKARSFEQ